jgi:hypothetical protein
VRFDNSVTCYLAEDWECWSRSAVIGHFHKPEPTRTGSIPVGYDFFPLVQSLLPLALLPFLLFPPIAGTYLDA